MAEPHACAVVGKMTTFDLWPFDLGGGAWGAGTNIWHPETLASYESHPTYLATQITTLYIHTSGGRGLGGALILNRCRAFDLFASVDAHLYACGQRQQKKSSTEQISAQLPTFQTDSSARNTSFEQKSTFSSNFAKNQSFDKIWKLTYIWSR